MRSYPIHEARADLSRLVDRALSGEPQRVTRRGREAVVIVSEEAWRARHPSPKPGVDEPTWQPRERYDNLGELIAHFARDVGFREEDFMRPGANERPLGADFMND
jgi:prevent-host-death family protein